MYQTEYCEAELGQRRNLIGSPDGALNCLCCGHQGSEAGRGEEGEGVMV